MQQYFLEGIFCTDFCHCTSSAAKSDQDGHNQQKTDKISLRFWKQQIVLPVTTYQHNHMTTVSFLTRQPEDPLNFSSITNADYFTSVLFEAIEVILLKINTLELSRSALNEDILKMLQMVEIILLQSSIKTCNSVNINF